ncbi:hypothetical protein [Paenibacillus sp. FJAT-26967]|nr:hypothetical protein [Paenibacillus sp. FJAT-26967]
MTLLRLNQRLEIHQHLIKLYRLLSANILPAGEDWVLGEIAELEVELDA